MWSFVCHSETLARSGQAAAISGKRFFVSQKVCFALKLPKFSAARAKEQEATFYCKRGPRVRKKSAVLLHNSGMSENFPIIRCLSLIRSRNFHVATMRGESHMSTILSSETLHFCSLAVFGPSDKVGPFSHEISTMLP